MIISAVGFSAFIPFHMLAYKWRDIIPSRLTTLSNRKSPIVYLVLKQNKNIHISSYNGGVELIFLR